MLRHRLPAYRRLMREGERAEGLVLTVEEPLTLSLGVFKFRLRIRALFEDGSRPEFTRMVDTTELIGEFAHAGDVWPLRYDAADRTRVDVDLAALRERILAERKRIEDTHLRRVEADLGERPAD